MRTNNGYSPVHLYKIGVIETNKCECVIGILEHIILVCV